MQTLAESNDVSDVVSRLNEIASYVLHRHVMTHADEVNGRSMVHSTAGSIKAAKTMLEKFVQSKPERDRDPSLTSKLCLIACAVVHGCSGVLMQEFCL